jgi:F-type H+-transporting ATPase subunit epsilon
MNTFILHVLSADHTERIEDVTSFVGEDATGSFGLLPHHARFMTTLVFGLARYRQRDGTWHYLACPGALVYFVDNALFLSTRHYVRGDDYQRMAQEVQAQLVQEEATLAAMRHSLRHLEEALVQRLWHMPEA